MSKLKIVNLVATADVNQSVDLIKTSKIEYTIFDPKIYGGRVAYIKNPKMNGKVIIFPSGKFISVGTRSPRKAEEDLQRVANILTQNGIIKPTKISAEIRNIVAVLTLSESINPEDIVQKYSVIYEPEQFAAVIMKQTHPKATMLIFNSGKVVISGVKNFIELKETVKNIMKIITNK